MEGADYMKVIVTGRNMHVRDSLVEQVEKKLTKFERYFNSDIEVHATFSHQKADQIVEITIPLKQGTTIRAEERSGNMESSIDMAIDKLARQISKHKNENWKSAIAAMKRFVLKKSQMLKILKQMVHKS